MRLRLIYLLEQIGPCDFCDVLSFIVRFYIIRSFLTSKFSDWVNTKQLRNEVCRFEERQKRIFFISAGLSVYYYYDAYFYRVFNPSFYYLKIRPCAMFCMDFPLTSRSHVGGSIVRAWSHLDQVLAFLLSGKRNYIYMFTFHFFNNFSDLFLLRGELNES